MNLKHINQVLFNCEKANKDDSAQFLPNHILIKIATKYNLIAEFIYVNSKFYNALLNLWIQNNFNKYCLREKYMRRLLENNLLCDMHKYYILFKSWNRMLKPGLILDIATEYRNKIRTDFNFIINLFNMAKSHSAHDIIDKIIYLYNELSCFEVTGRRGMTGVCVDYEIAAIYCGNFGKPAEYIYINSIDYDNFKVDDKYIGYMCNMYGADVIRYNKITCEICSRRMTDNQHASLARQLVYISNRHIKRKKALTLIDRGGSIIKTATNFDNTRSPLHIWYFYKMFGTGTTFCINTELVKNNYIQYLFLKNFQKKDDIMLKTYINIEYMLYGTVANLIKQIAATFCIKDILYVVKLLPRNDEFLNIIELINKLK